MRSLATLATFLALAIVTSATVNAAPNSYAMSVLSVLTDPQKGMRFLEVEEQDLTVRLNDLRINKHLNTLIPRASLILAARSHSARMLRDGFFAHRDPEKGEVAHRVAAVDRTGLYRTVGENLAKISPVIPDLTERMHKGWVNSPGHYKNMIGREYDHIGIGCARYRKETACTQVFGGLTAELASPMPLVIAKGQSVARQPEFIGMSFGGWQLVDANGLIKAKSSSHEFTSPAGLHGDLQMQVMGLKPVSKRRHIISNFFGPTVILE
jgi:uncharacterized protein YkwD